MLSLQFPTNTPINNASYFILPLFFTKYSRKTFFFHFIYKPSLLSSLSFVYFIPFSVLRERKKKKRRASNIMSAFYNTLDKKVNAPPPQAPPQPQAQSKNVFLPPIVSNTSNLDVGQKRPWLEDDSRDAKTQRTEHKVPGKLEGKACVIRVMKEEKPRTAGILISLSIL